MVEPLADVVAAVSRPSIFHTQVLPAGILAEGRVKETVPALTSSVSVFLMSSALAFCAKAVWRLAKSSTKVARKYRLKLLKMDAFIFNHLKNEVISRWSKLFLLKFRI